MAYKELMICPLSSALSHDSLPAIPYTLVTLAFCHFLNLFFISTPLPELLCRTLYYADCSERSSLLAFPLVPESD